MLDIKRVINNPEELRTALSNRNKDTNISRILDLDSSRRSLLAQTETLKSTRNSVSQQIATIKRNGGDAEALMEEMRIAGDKIKELDVQVAQVEAELNNLLISIPNIPHSSVPIGKGEEENAVVRTWGEPKKFDFTPQAHWDIGDALGIIDPTTGAKVTGARFTFMKGYGARLERSIMNFMLDTHTSESGYTEIFPPFMANRDSMTGTGQLPKFEEDMFRVSNTEYFLIPTAEVPITNMYRDDILDGSRLPIYHCAYSACFRAEAGSAGRDTRGLIRQHQFNKVELVKFATPETSYDELESLTNAAEKILQKLGLPYRVSLLSTGDMGFSSAKTYDLEVWMPSYNRYVEISSCSNFEDFQARRANIKYRATAKDKPQFVHTLNGSGLAIGRTVAAIIENYQQADGTVLVPEALRGYMGTDVIK